jgi:hypothetical protein
MIFSRKAKQPDGAIARFWAWWPAARPRIEAAIASGGWSDLQAEVNGLVSAIHRDLQWEFSKGTVAEHAFVVAPAGNPKLRAVAARWLAAAPAADATWEFHDSRQPDPNVFTATMELEGHKLDLSLLRFASTPDVDRHELDVVGYHPVFAELPDGARAQVTFLALDWLLGETAVELWIGGVSWSTTPPAGAQPPNALAEAVAALAEEHRGGDDAALLTGEKRSGMPLVAMVHMPLKSARWPRFDRHVAITLRFRLANDAGLPLDESLQALRAFEDGLNETLGDTGEIVAVETSEGARVLHAYVDSESDGVAAIERAMSGWHEGKSSIKQAYDPGLENVAHLRP